eukprot:11159179-Lingulodinium_polyedra.AAC.1
MHLCEARVPGKEVLQFCLEYRIERHGLNRQRLRNVRNAAYVTVYVDHAIYQITPGGVANNAPPRKD